EELSATENKIAFSRQFYNDTVQKYNTKLQVFPAVLIAGLFGFKPAEYFNLEGSAGARNPVDVKFE
ncbi:MAG TPA: LemA family protein, partial [Firmicutes bacterium]|nr:LemA family protein [Bacillota bacterium]